MKRKSKKILMLTIIITTLMLFLAFNTSAKEPAETGNIGSLTYTFDSTTGTLVVSGEGEGTNYTRDYNAPFYESEQIKKIIIEEGITKIGKYTFNYCKNLETVVIPKSLKTIETMAFQFCPNLEVPLLHEGMEFIGERAFYNCKVTEKFYYPSTLSVYNYSSLPDIVELTLSDSMTEIPESILGAKKLILGKGIIEIKKDAFRSYKLEEVIMTDSVKSIGDYAFYSCKYLTKIVMSKNIETIGKSAFSGCESLIEIDLGNKLTLIQDYTFSDCTALKTVVIPDSVEYIYTGAFYDCESLENITLPSKLTKINESSFKGCKSLKAIVFPESIELIEEDAFFGCESLKKVVIPKKVATIESGAFSYCKNLTEFIVLNKDLELTASYSGAFGYFMPDNLVIISYPDSEAFDFAEDEEIKFVSIVCDAPVIKSVSNKADSVVLKWDASENATKYLVYRKVNKETSWKLVKTVTGKSYTDKDVKEGKTYTYTVRAANDYVEGNRDETGIVIERLLVPELESAKSTKNGVLVKWLESTGAEGYYVYRNDGSGWTKIATVNNEVKYYDKEAVYGKTYTYTIMAKSSVGYNNSKSAYDKSGLSAKVKYIASTELTAIKMSKIGSVYLQWTKTSGSDKYYVYRSTKANSGFSCIAKITKTNYTDSSVKFNTTYYYKIVSYKGSVKSASSPYKSVKTTIPYPVVKNTTVTTKSIKLNWEKVPEATGYVVYRKNSKGAWESIARLSASATSYTDKVSGKKTYKILSYVKRSGTNYYSASSDVIYASTLGKTTIDVDMYKNEFADIITWKKVSGATGYQIYRKVGNGSWSHFKTVGAVTEFVTDVTHGKCYYWKIRAIYKTQGVASIGEFSNVDSLIIGQSPSLHGITPDDVSVSNVVCLSIKNNGDYTVRIKSDGARIYNPGYSNLSGFIYLMDENVNFPKYIDIPAGEIAFIFFYTGDAGGYYDSDSVIYFYFDYDGLNYSARSRFNGYKNCLTVSQI